MSGLRQIPGKTSLFVFQDYQREFVRHLRDPSRFPPPAGVSVERVGIYVELVRNKIEDSLASCFPVTRALLGTRRWEDLVRRFIAGHHCLSPLYRQIPDEFLAYLRDEWNETPEPAFLAELAHFEWMELHLAIAKDRLPDEPLDGNGSLLDGFPVFAPAMALLRYAYPVHRIVAEAPVWPSGSKEPATLLGFRDRAYTVRFIELNEPAAALVERLMTGASSGRTVLRKLASDWKFLDPEAFMAFGMDILVRLREQGAILGTRRAPFVQCQWGQP
ncbi:MULTISPECIES: HvfC family RiPP maturation protein [Methylococcus]|uniref:DNA-binding domain-containing protein n=1 Tax=Methylococcus capsulatus TaxID=414 RepID=A0ABZ2F4L2_METCP|nr:MULTISPECIES: putative DNA-binding domain-containing protein [Methylococcus]MDF9391962.1 DUF2063 domain-containing protein [Methylococcus capsulatus]